MDQERNQPAGSWPRQRQEQLLLVLSALGSVLMLRWVVGLARYGFDYTDEAYYLIWAARPFDYPASPTQFGFVYHPLYLEVHGSVAAFRAAGFVITFALGTLAAWGVLRKAWGDHGPATATRVVLAAALGTLALLYAQFAGEWLPTPSYNSLALQATLLTTLAVCLADRSWSCRSTLGWALGGLGLAVAFLAKPTTAAALGVLAGCYFLVTRQARIAQFLLAGAIALAVLVLSAFAIDGSIGAFVQRHAAGLALARLLQAGYGLGDIFRLERPPMGHTSFVLCLLLGAALAPALWLTQWRRAPAAGGLLALLVLGAGTYAAFRRIPPDAIPGLQRSILPFAPVLAAVVAGFVLLRWTGVKDIGRARWALAAMLLTFAYAYGFGSGSNYWAAMGSASILVALAGFAVLAGLGQRSASGTFFLVLALGLQGVLFAVIHQSVLTPYRQAEPLAQHAYRVRVGESDLLLSKADADYLVPVYEAARRNGFRPGTPVIDLSGRSPGLLYAMQARSAGLPWNLSGYPGTAAYVKRGFQWTDCQELASAWVLAQSKGPIEPVPPGVLAAFGADLHRDYEPLATTVSPSGQVQTLMKPTRPREQALQACRTARSQQAAQG